MLDVGVDGLIIGVMRRMLRRLCSILVPEKALLNSCALFDSGMARDVAVCLLGVGVCDGFLHFC